MRRNNILYLILLIMTIMFIGGMINHFSSKKGTEVATDTLVTVHYDTVYNTIIKVVEKPVLRRVETIKHDTVYQSNDTVITLPIERKIYNDTLTFDVDTVIVESSIVGINPSLESLKARLIRQRINQTTEKIITKKVPQKGFFIAPNASIGYGIFSKQPDIYLGIGVGYRF